MPLPLIVNRTSILDKKQAGLSTAARLHHVREQLSAKLIHLLQRTMLSSASRYSSDCSN